jgi:hypothetical protein
MNILALIKDVPLVTLQLCHKGIRCQSCARSVTVCTGGFVGWQLELAIVAASLGTSVRLREQGGCLEAFGAS